MNSKTTTNGTTAKKPVPTKKPASKKPTKAPTPLTITQLCELYLKHLKAVGKSPSTQVSYAGDLLLAIDELGSDTKVNTLTANKVKAFYASDAVKKTAAGKPKARPTILKTRRVLRMALTWAAEAGKIKEVPLPDRKIETTV